MGKTNTRKGRLLMIYLFLAEGFEEIEALTPVDVLRRGKTELVTVGVGSKFVKGSHGINVEADITTDDITTFDGVDAVILPGGMPGTLNLEKNKTVIDATKYCFENNKIIGAICAAPSILGHLGMLRGKSATAFPAFQSELEGADPGDFVEQDGNIITARGMGVALEFGLKLLEVLKGADESKRVRDSLQCR